MGERAVRRAERFVERTAHVKGPLGRGADRWNTRTVAPRAAVVRRFSSWIAEFFSEHYFGEISPGVLWVDDL